MKKHFKDFFIPHEGNNYHPHFLHTKRAVFYAGFFLSLKALVFLFALLIPSVVFVMPDVLAEEEEKLRLLTNALRQEQGIAPLSPLSTLHVSSRQKAVDMANLQYFGHISPQDSQLGNFLKEAGYNYTVAGENLAMGFTSAEEIFSAWMKSPSHYANLVDPEFTQFGVSIENGYFDNLSTVYVAQHFGTPKTNLFTSFPLIENKNSVPTSTPDPLSSSAVAVAPVNSVQIQRKNSFVDWKEQGEMSYFMAQVSIEGKVEKAVVNIGPYFIPLQHQEGGLYLGELSINKPINSFFQPVVEPSLQVIDENNQVHYFTLSWKSVKIVSPTPLEKYREAKQSGGIVSTLFDFSKGVYIFFIGLFSLALLVSIVVQVRRQHHHVTAQTLGLLLLLISLVLI